MATFPLQSVIILIVVISIKKGQAVADSYLRNCAILSGSVNSGLCAGDYFKFSICEYDGMPSMKRTQFQVGLNDLERYTTKNCTSQLDQICQNLFSSSSVRNCNPIVCLNI